MGRLTPRMFSKFCRSVLAKDLFICQKCNKKGGNFKVFFKGAIPTTETYFDHDLGTTICKECFPTMRDTGGNTITPVS